MKSMESLKPGENEISFSQFFFVPENGTLLLMNRKESSLLALGIFCIAMKLFLARQCPFGSPGES